MQSHLRAAGTAVLRWAAPGLRPPSSGAAAETGGCAPWRALAAPSRGASSSAEDGGSNSLADGAAASTARAGGSREGMPAAARTTSSGTSSSSSGGGGGAAAPPASPASSATAAGPPGSAPLFEADTRLERLMRVLLHPISRSRRWRGQLSDHLVAVNGQLLVEPEAVLTSTLRALHVLQGVLQEDGHVYVVENHPLLRSLLREAARACVNPNVWFMDTPWARGTLTNAASHRRLFLPAHQPNRRLFLEKGLRMVNPHHPEPSGPPPRLDWEDKWALYARADQPGYRQLLEDLLRAEHGLHTLKPPRMLAGRGRDLRLMIVLDTSSNSIALSEAVQRGVPTVALASGQADMSPVTYPVLARDFSPEFVHFFLDMLVKVANVGPRERSQPPKGAEAAAEA